MYNIVLYAGSFSTNRKQQKNLDDKRSVLYNSDLGRDGVNLLKLEMSTNNIGQAILYCKTAPTWTVFVSRIVLGR
jgi:hypothetical protein